MNGKSLQLPRTLPMGPGQEAKKTISQKWDTIDDQLEEMHAKGFVSRDPPPEACPELTSAMLTTTDSQSYSDTFARLNAWFGYVSEVYAEVQARVLQYENIKDILEAEGRRINRELNQSETKKPTVQELADRLLLNPEYQEVMILLQRYKQSKMLFAAKVDSIERSLKTVSRQIEVRKLDQENTRVGSNLPSRNRWGQGGS